MYLLKGCINQPILVIFPILLQFHILDIILTVNKKSMKPIIWEGPGKEEQNMKT